MNEQVNKKMQWINGILATTMLIVGICTLVIGITRLAGIELPDIAQRIMGVVELISCPLMVYSGVTKFMMMKDKAKETAQKKIKK